MHWRHLKPPWLGSEADRQIGTDRMVLALIANLASIGRSEPGIRTDLHAKFRF